jgi:DNA-directed RNA polymerase specialized sigma24 family protein
VAVKNSAACSINYLSIALGVSGRSGKRRDWGTRPMDSTTHWILQIAEGNRAAADELWRRYYQRLVEFARRRLRSAPRGAADEEDIALSAFDSFYRAAEAGRFPDLQDSDGLWRLLITIAARKTANRLRHDHRLKCDVRRVDPSGAEALDRQIAQEPTPAFVVETIETCRDLLGRLPDGLSRSIAMRRMEGYSNPEIARELKRSLSTIERKLRLIRRHFVETE